MTNEIYVTSKSSKQSVNASSDLSNYYSRLSRQWAISNEIVNNEDYSSKYYAEQTKVIYDDAVNIIGLEKEKALNSINNTKLDAILTVEDEGNKQVLLATEQAQIATNKANEIINMTDILANNDLSNLSDLGEKHFLNKTQITNCILEAPNGVATYSGSTFTAKAGLKVLIPNGRNSDGSLNNIEYTLPNDITYTISSADRPASVLILKNDGSLGYANPYYYQEDTPSSNYGLWFNPTDNYIYLNDANKNTIIYGGVIASFGTTTAGISWLSPYSPIELLKRTDVSYIWTKEKATTTSSANASKPAVVVKNYVNNTSWYRLYSDGWCEQGGSLIVDAHTSKTFTLLREYSNTNYTVLYAGGGWNDSFTKSDDGITAKTTKSFTYGTTAGSSSNGNWYACGY